MMKHEELVNLIGIREDRVSLNAQQKTQRIIDEKNRTDEIFNIIKNSVMDDLIKRSIDRGYTVGYSDVSYCVLNNILENEAFDVSWKFVYLTYSGNYYDMQPKREVLDEYSKKLSAFKNSFSEYTIYQKICELLEMNGFVKSNSYAHISHPEWHTTKEKLIRNSNGGGYRTTKCHSKLKESLIGWQALGVVITFMVLFLTYKAYL